MGGVLAASADRRLRVLDGDHRSVAELDAFHAAACAAALSRAHQRCIMADWETLIDYLRLRCGHAGIEHFRVLMLDVRFGLIRDELMAVGTIDHAAVHVREVLHRALDAGAAGILLVHNHPSGNCSPSSSDIALTRKIAAAGKPLNIALIDHVVVSASDHASMHRLGLLV